MNASLPDPIITFFAVSNGADAVSLDQCFAEDAVVQDEKQVHHGRAAIGAWLRAARRKYAYTVQPLDVALQDSGLKIRARVSGNFPGSPVELSHLFRLSGDRIEFLEIG